jgi:hypothetical protein
MFPDQGVRRRDQRGVVKGPDKMPSLPRQRRVSKRRIPDLIPVLTPARVVTRVKRLMNSIQARYHHVGWQYRVERPLKSLVGQRRNDVAVGYLSIGMDPAIRAPRKCDRHRFPGNLLKSSGQLTGDGPLRGLHLSPEERSPIICQLKPKAAGGRCRRGS